MIQPTHAERASFARKSFGRKVVPRRGQAGVVGWLRNYSNMSGCCNRHQVLPPCFSHHLIVSPCELPYCSHCSGRKASIMNRLEFIWLSLFRASMCLRVRTFLLFPAGSCTEVQTLAVPTQPRDRQAQHLLNSVGAVPACFKGKLYPCVYTSLQGMKRPRRSHIHHCNFRQDQTEKQQLG